MYIMLGIMILIVGVLLAILTYCVRDKINSKFMIGVLCIFGIVLICIGIYEIYLVVSGEIVLPLIK